MGTGSANHTKIINKINLKSINLLKSNAINNCHWLISRLLYSRHSQ